MSLLNPHPLPDLLRSREALRAGFEAGLARMLAAHPDLGVAILVLANATYDARIWGRLKEPLRARFSELEARSRSGAPLQAPPDDRAVLQRLLAVGFDRLETTRFRREGPWALQYNPLRALRPPRMSHAVVASLYRPFDPDGFHFNKPFLQRELLWQGELLGRRAALLYNKFPFADLHGLLAPSPQDCLPQYLRQADHAHLWALAEALGESLPEAGFGYNSYGAYASVNHLHFQFFVTEAGLPAEDKRWRHNGGGRDYPCRCEAFDQQGRAWGLIQRLHDRNIAYNLIYRPGRLYCLPRPFQGSYQHAAWTGGYAWCEMAGALTTFDAERFESLSQAELEQELQKLRFGPEPAEG